MLKDENVQGCHDISDSPPDVTLEGPGDSLAPLAVLPCPEPSYPYPGVAGLNSAPSCGGSVISTIRQTSVLSEPAASISTDQTKAPELFPTPEIIGLDSYSKSPCKKRYIVSECACGRSVLPSSCMSLKCPRCAPWVGRRRALSVFDRLTERNDSAHKFGYSRRAVIYTVFTIPPANRESLTDQLAWQKVRSKAWQILKQYFGALFAVEASHPCGEESSVFHPHLNFLWVQRPGFRAYIDTDKLRLKWMELFGAAVVDVWSAYTHDDPLIMKWAKYITRVFVGYHWWTGALRWFGKYPKSTWKGVCECPICHGNMRIIGVMDAELVDDYWKIGVWMGKDPPWDNDNNIRRYGRKAQKGKEICR